MGRGAGSLAAGGLLNKVAKKMAPTSGAMLTNDLVVQSSELVTHSDAEGSRVERNVHVLTCGQVVGGAEFGLGVSQIHEPFVTQGQRGTNLRCQDELGVNAQLGRRATRVGRGGQFATALRIKEVGVGGTQADVGPELGAGFQKPVLQKDRDRQGLDLGDLSRALHGACTHDLVLERQCHWHIDRQVVGVHVGHAASELCVAADIGARASQGTTDPVVTKIRG